MGAFGRVVAAVASLCRRHPELGVCAALILVVVLANAASLGHVIDQNPLHQVSGLGVTIRPGAAPGLDTIDPNSGFTTQALGHLAATDWLHGTVPWWNHYEGVGAPLAGEMQSAAMFPLVVLLALANGLLYLHLLLEIVTGLATLLLLRRLGACRWAAFAGAAAFSVNGTFAWLGHAPVNPIAFLPLLLLGVELIYGTDDHGGAGWLLVAVALALSLYAGFPETAYIDGLLVAIWVGVRAVQVARQDPGRGPGAAVVRFVGRVATGAVAGVLLAAPVLVAFVDYLGGATTAHSGTFAHASLVKAAAPMTVLPYVYGPIFGFYTYDGSGKVAAAWGSIGGFTTLAVVLLALVGLVGRRHRGLRVALGVWVVVCLSRTFGLAPAVTLMNLLPQMANVAFYRYAPPSWELALVVLAALGLDDIVQREVSTVWLLVAGSLALLLCVASGVLALPLVHHLVGAPHHRAWALGSAGWGVAVIVVGVALALVPKAAVRAAGLALLVVVDALVMFAVPQLSAPRSTTFDSAPIAFLKAHLGSYRLFSLGPLLPNYGSYFDLASVNINDIPIPKKWADYITASLDGNVNPILFTGTTTLDSAGPSPAQEFVDHATNFEAVGVRYVLVPAGVTLPAPSPGAQPVALQMVYSDPQVQILALPDPSPYFSEPTGACELRAAGPDRVVARCPSATVLVRQELSMPGWRATVDGRAAPIRQAGALFQQVSLPAGTSTVQFDFQPPHTSLALLAFGAGILLLMAGGATEIAGRRRPRSRGRLHGHHRRHRRQTAADGPAGAPTGEPAGAPTQETAHRATGRAGPGIDVGAAVPGATSEGP